MTSFSTPPIPPTSPEDVAAAVEFRRDQSRGRLSWFERVGAVVVGTGILVFVGSVLWRWLT